MSDRKPHARGARIALGSGALAMLAAGIFVLASGPVLRARWQIQRLGSARWETFAEAYQGLIELPEGRAGEVIAALSNARARCSFPVPDGDGGRTDKPFGIWRQSNGTPPGAPRAAVLTRVFFRLLARDLIARGGDPAAFGLKIAGTQPGSRVFFSGGGSIRTANFILASGKSSGHFTVRGTNLRIEVYEAPSGDNIFFPAADLVLDPDSARDLWSRRQEITASWEAFYSAVKPYMFFEPESIPGGS